MSLVRTATLLLVGAATGWWLRELIGTAPAQLPTQQQAASPARVSPDGAASSAEPGTRPRAFSSPSSNPPSAKASAKPYTASFASLLANSDYETAFDRLLAMEKAGDQSYAGAREQALAHLAGLQQTPGDGRFNRAIQAYLERYYGDIDALLLLARHRARLGQFPEALSDLQMASTYALDMAQRARVRTAVGACSEQAEAFFGDSDGMPELIGYYELLASMGLAGDAQRFRQAQLYLRGAYPHLALPILDTLAQRDEWRERASALAGKAAGEQGDSAFQPAGAPGSAVPLLRRGRHYLVPANAGRADLQLLIDTGASTTSLTRASFERLAGTVEHQYVGSRMFHTANGIAAGEVYRIPELTLGDYRVAPLEIAVLDIAGGGEVDGLLGMNVLSRFRFEIDQDEALLRLQVR